MFDFKLSDDQKQYRQLANEFAQNEIAPQAHHLDATGEFPEAIIQQAFELGLMNLHIEEEFGGLNLGLVDATIIAEEFGKACSAVGIAIMANDFACAPILLSGSTKQKEMFLKPLANKLSFAASGYFSATNALSFNQGQDSFVINGSIKRTSNADQAQWFCILANKEGGGQNHSAIFVIPADSPGISVGTKQLALGLRADDARSVNFANVSVSKENLIGAIGEGSTIAHKSLSRLYPIWAALAVGTAGSCLVSSTKYAQERITFGKPIADNQAISFMLADMAKDIQASRLLSLQAAWLAQKQSSAVKEGLIAHAQATQTAMKAAIDAVQIFGGYGYSKEYPVEKLMRDAKMLQIYPSDTTSEFATIGHGLTNVSR